MVSTTTSSLVVVALLSWSFSRTSAATATVASAKPGLPDCNNNVNKGIFSSRRNQRGQAPNGKIHSDEKSRIGAYKNSTKEPTRLLFRFSTEERKRRRATTDTQLMATLPVLNTTPLTAGDGRVCSTAAVISRVAFLPSRRGCSRNVPHLVSPGGGQKPPSGGTSNSAFAMKSRIFPGAELRGGGKGGHPWFTGYSDTEETPYETEYEAEESEGESGENSEEVEDSNAVGDEDKESASGVDQETEEIDRFLSSDEGPWGARSPAASTDPNRDEPDSDNADSEEERETLKCDVITGSSSNGNMHKGKTGGRSGKEARVHGKKSNGTQLSSRTPIGTQDVYARTVARRVSMLSVFTVLRRALVRSLMLLVAFQFLPWLRYNPLARWLLGLSLLLQTVHELVKALSAGSTVGNHGRGKGDTDEAWSQGTGMPGSSPRAGIVGGLLRAMSPEQEQHLEFEKLNDHFQKDVEALAAATRSKAETAGLLMEGAAQDSRMLGASVMRAFMGFSGPLGSKASEASDTSTDEKDDTAQKTNKKRRRRRSSKKEGSSAEREEEPKGPSPPSSAEEEVVFRHASGDNSTADAVQPKPAANDTSMDEPAKVRKRVFVVKFGGGSSSAMEDPVQLLSETVSFLVANGNTTTDEMVLCLESGGGEVTQFGLLAAMLARVKESGIRLTVCVDKIAASGGYMMACVADWLVVAPFAMLGSIGVLGGIPNFNKALKRAGVEYYHFTAGDNKSLVGPFQEVTKAHQAKQQKQLDVIHMAFKRHIQQYRPSVDVNLVGTGEVWLGLEAVDLKLADEVGTGGDYLQGRMSDSDVFLVKPHQKKSIKGVSSIVRQLLLGPLASAAAFPRRLVALMRAFEQLSALAGLGGDELEFSPGGGRLRPSPGFHARGTARELEPTGVFAPSTTGFRSRRRPGDFAGLSPAGDRLSSSPDFGGTMDVAALRAPPATGIFAAASGIVGESWQGSKNDFSEISEISNSGHAS